MAPIIRLLTSATTSMAAFMSSTAPLRRAATAPRLFSPLASRATLTSRSFATNNGGLGNNRMGAAGFFARGQQLRAFPALSFLTVALLSTRGGAAKADDGFETSSSGLKFKIIKEGTGAIPAPGQTVNVHYTGWLDGFDDAGRKFDSSYDRRSPLSFRAGVGQVIRGWDEAVLQMKVGEKRNVIIPPDLGYGARGAGGVIPPNATLYFTMELISI